LPSVVFKNKLHKDTYGKTSCIVQQPLIIENPAMLAIQQKKTGAATTTQNGVEGKPFAMPSNYPVTCTIGWEPRVLLVVFVSL